MLLRLMRLCVSVIVLLVLVFRLSSLWQLSLKPLLSDRRERQSRRLFPSEGGAAAAARAASKSPHRSELRKFSPR